MCYSAQVYAGYKKFVREFGAIIDLKSYAKAVFYDPAKKRAKWPKAMEDAFLRDAQTDEERQIGQDIARWNGDETAKLEQELFAQSKRKADAERSLQTKATKAATESIRIAGNKIEQIKGRLSDLRRTEPAEKDSRIYPGYYAPVMVWEDGARVIKPMRYQCRVAGSSATPDRKLPEPYNARRDSLEKYWRKQFGTSHGLILASAFFEHVEQNGQDTVLEFKPSNGQDMLVACLWSKWIGSDGEELLSFAAITDDPPVEVAAAGHDRCIIPIKAEHIDAWLNPDPMNLAAQYRILDDRQRPFFEHRIAA